MNVLEVFHIIENALEISCYILFQGRQRFDIAIFQSIFGNIDD